MRRRRRRLGHKDGREAAPPGVYLQSIELVMAAALAEAMQLACDAALAGDLGVVQQRLREAEHLEGCD